MDLADLKQACCGAHESPDGAEGCNAAYQVGVLLWLLK
jgi:hypothetical protein